MAKYFCLPDSPNIMLIKFLHYTVGLCVTEQVVALSNTDIVLCQHSGKTKNTCPFVLFRSKKTGSYMLSGNSFDDKNSNAVVAKKFGSLPPPGLSTSENAAGSIPMSQNISAHIHPYEGVTEFHLCLDKESNEQDLTVAGDVSFDE